MKKFREFLTEGMPIKPAEENIHDVISANFTHGKYMGNRSLHIDKLKGGVNLSDPQEKSRVNKLSTAMKEGGYIRRLIADTNGNVIEGQHRLEALRQNGIKEVPVHLIHDLAHDIDIKGVHSAIKNVGSLHSDHIHQITHNSLEMAHDSGSGRAALKAYEMPRGFETHHEAALKEIDRQRHL